MLETLDYSKPRLLVVDDNKENRTWLARRLVRDGYQVIVAGSGADALEQIDLQPVNLVLLDVQMPDMDGLQVLEEIRKTFNEQEMPVLMVSANTDTPTKVAAMDGGANDYLQKPVEYDFLLAKLRGYLKRSGSGQVAGPPPAAAPAAPVSTPAPTSTRVDVGDMVGHYRVTGLLGEGGMGKVFRATDERLLRDVALKVMTSEGRPANLGRFLTEARAVARIAHPCIATIYDISEQPVPYIAMELVQGRELQHHTGGHPVPAAQAVDWTRQIAETLQVVHEHGILHRDLKPANIMVTPDGRLKVMDFGLAKIAELDQKLTRTGELWGTPHYMSPEHFDPSRGPVDAQSDIFALAGIMFELLTARLAFASNAMGTLIFEIISQDPPPVHTLEPSVPPEVSAIVARGLAKQKADRYPNAAAMAADLRALQL